MLQKTLTDRLITLLGDDFSFVMEAFSTEKSGFFRVNPLKSSSEEVLAEFDVKGIVTEKYHESYGIYRFSKDQEYAIKGTDAFYGGKIYLQSLASMIPPFVLDPGKDSRVLDVCAAPGSKATELAVLMENSWEIVALEKNQIRHDKLAYNIRLQNALNIVTKKIDARKYFAESDESFDRVLLDVPCSAEGRIFLDNEKSYGFWTMKNIREKHDLQYELLTGSIEHLKKWWMLVYSTCTLAPEENELVVARILSEYRDLELETIENPLLDVGFMRSGVNLVGLSRELFPLVSELDWQHRMAEEIAEKTKRILPTKNTEWFFIAKIRKK